MKQLRGYFGVGIEGLSKPMNLGALQRTAHAFGAAFTFTVSAAPKIRVMHNADTSKSDLHVPWYLWNSIEEMQLPKGCVLVGIELTDAAVDLPAFRQIARGALRVGVGEHEDQTEDEGDEGIKDEGVGGGDGKDGNANLAGKRQQTHNGNEG